MNAKQTYAKPVASEELRRLLIRAARAHKRTAEKIIAEAARWNARHSRSPLDDTRARVELAWALSILERYETNQ